VPDHLAQVLELLAMRPGLEPGGNIELSCASGRDVIKDICGEIKIPFSV